MIKKERLLYRNGRAVFLFSVCEVCLCGGRNRELPFIFYIPEITLSI